MARLRTRVIQSPQPFVETSEALRDRFMQYWSKTISSLLHRWLRISLLALLLLTFSVGLSGAWWNFNGSDSNTRDSRLPAGNAITDGRALLRYALPIDNEAVRQLQADLEDIKDELRAARRWSPIQRYLKDASRVLSQRRDELLEDVVASKRTQAETLLAQLNEGITAMEAAVDQKDKEQLWIKRSELLDTVSQLEEWMVEDEQVSYNVPEEYQDLPQLHGRATVEIQTNKGALTVVADGYNAPITAGNFVDLVQRGFYDSLEFTRAEDAYFLQTGDPPGPEAGFVDPETGEYRAIPLEIKLQGESAPIYGVTLEEAGRYREQPMLPFSAYGTVAMARPGNDPNGGSSQFFFLLFDPELTPAGANLLDGRYAVFGYTVAGKETLEKLKAGDRIESAKVIRGAENLVSPQAA